MYFTEQQRREIRLITLQVMDHARACYTQKPKVTGPASADPGVGTNPTTTPEPVTPSSRRPSAQVHPQGDDRTGINDPGEASPLKTEKPAPPAKPAVDKAEDAVVALAEEYMASGEKSYHRAKTRARSEVSKRMRTARSQASADRAYTQKYE